MNLKVNSDEYGTDYDLHSLSLVAQVYEANKPSEFFVFSDENPSRNVKVRLFLHRRELLSLREEIDAVLEKTQQPETGIKVEETCT